MREAANKRFEICLTMPNLKQRGVSSGLRAITRHSRTKIAVACDKHKEDKNIEVLLILMLVAGGNVEACMGF